jgi:hypothetical protein
MARKPTRASKLLGEMRRNPKGDWRIEQLDTVARAYEVNVRRGRGSHVLMPCPFQLAVRSSRSTYVDSSR